MKKLGLDYETLKGINRGIVWASITGYGQDGPYSNRRVYDNVIQAASGLAHVQSDPATGEPIGGTSDNLKAAIAGETHEYTDMYPGMAATARDEGFDEIADWFETLAKAERSHANRFQKALDTLDS